MGLALLVLSGVFTTPAAAQTAALTGTVTDDSEADIRAGGSTIILTLTGDTWANLNPARKQDIIDGLVSAQGEAAGWNAEVQPNIPTGNVDRTSDSVVTITLPVVATYDITATETITATIPANVLSGGSPIVAAPTFDITAISAALSGTVTDDSEADIRAGGSTLILTLTNDTWVAAGGTFDAQRQNIIDGLDSAQAEAAGWDAVVKAGLAVTDVVRTSATVVTVTLPPFGGYDITAAETITATIPATAVTGGGAIIAAPTFDVVPISAALSGTVTDDSEIDIRAGGSTLILTLTGDTWVAAGGTFDAQRQNIINGLDSAQAEAAGWDAVVKAGLSVTDVVRTSNTVVTVTLPAFATYDITAIETITATIPATAVSGGSAIVAVPNFNVTHDSPWYDSNWPSRKAITLDGSTFCKSVNAFPVPVILASDADLAANALIDGSDILFTADDGITKLPHEIEAFDKGTGALAAWVKLDIVSGTDQTLYMYYGNSGAADQQDLPGLWDTNFMRVYHLEENVTDEATGGTHQDSTGTLNGTQYYNAPIAGQIAGAQDFDGTGDYVDIGTVGGINNAVTLSGWVKHNNLTNTVERYIDLSNEVFIRHDGVNSVGQLHSSLRFGNSPDIYHYLRVNGVLANDTWYHVAQTWDGTTHRVYLNGAEQDSQVPGLGVPLLAPDGVCKISHDVVTMNGIIDEVRVSNIARSPDWLEAEVCTAGGVVGGTGSPQYPAVTSAVAEIAPNAVGAGSTGNTFTYDILLTVGASDTGVNQVVISAPAGYANLNVTAVSLGGTGKVVNCPTPGAGQYCASITGQDITVTLGDQGGNGQVIQVVFNADAPGTAGSASFTSTVDDTATSTPAQAANTGNADGDGADNNSWTVTVTDLTVSGTVYEDRNGDANLADAVGIQNVAVDLYRDGGDLVPNAADDTTAGNTTTLAGGAYSFAGLYDGTYWVVADSTTLAPDAGYTGGATIDDVWAEQTYGSTGAQCADGAGGTAERGSAGPCFGGQNEDASDDATGLLNAEHVIKVTVSGGDVTNVDFGFSFNAVTNALAGDNRDDDVLAARTVQGSLRQFIQNANAVSGANTMRFVPAVATNQTGGGGDWWQIAVTNVMPDITDSDTTIDGSAYSFSDGSTARDDNPGVLGTGGTVGVDGIALPQASRPELEIADTGNQAVGLNIEAADVTIRSLSVWGFGTDTNPTTDGQANIRVGNVTGALIEQNVLGSPPDSFTDPGAATRTVGQNIRMQGGDSGTIRNNLIGFAASVGILPTSGATGWTIDYNEIRQNALAGADWDGIDIQDSSGSETIRYNLFTGHSGSGIDMWRSVGGTLIENNTVSNNGSGGVEDSGLRIWGDGNTIQSNIITGNAGSGIMVVNYDTGAPIPVPYDANSISQNSIFNNGKIGIDLHTAGEDEQLGTAPYVTPNDPNDGDSGANLGMNYPLINSASETTGTVTVDYGLDTNTSGYYRVEFFKNPSGADGSGNGEGETFADAVVINHTGSGLESFSHGFAGSAGDVLSATTTVCVDGASCATLGSSSEFSAAYTATAAGCGATLLPFSDDFSRADSSTVGNCWTEAESGGDVQINSGSLLLDSTDQDISPRAMHTFTQQTTGYLKWAFDFNWVRSGGEANYEVWMQLGDSSQMQNISAAGDHQGVGVNLKWAGSGDGMPAHEYLGYQATAGLTPLQGLTGAHTIEVVANLDTDRYDIIVDGTTWANGVPFHNTVDIDAVRFYTNGLNSANLSGETFDDVLIETIDCTSGRVSDGLQVLYDFSEGSGTTVSDVSGVGAPLNLTIQDIGNVTWIGGGGLSVDAGTIISSGAAATKITTAAQASNEITIEAWVTPANTTQSGPARMVTLSADTGNRNFTVGAQGSQYENRLRTSTNCVNADCPATVTTTNPVATALQHVVYTRDTSGTARVYIDGSEVFSRNDITGDFSNWNAGYNFALANEFTQDRPWLGEYYMAAVYSKALTHYEVCRNFTFGAIVGSNAVSSAAAEITPNDVATGSPANAFTYDILPTIGGSDTGVDRVDITVPATFGAPTVTGVSVGGAPLTAGVDYTDNTAGQLIRIDLTVKVTVDATNIRVQFTADAPATADAAGKDFTSMLDDTTTGVAAQAAAEGNADGDAGDNNSWTVTTTGAPWFNPGWPYRKAVILDGSNFCATVSAFPVPVNLSGDADLQNYARADGFDIVFTESDGTTKLSHEIESFTKASGDLIAWVKLDITAGLDETIFMYYGNSGAADQQDTAALWTAYNGVWHLDESGNGTAGEFVDSTGNGRDAQLSPDRIGTDPVPVAARIDDGQQFDGSGNWIETGDHVDLEPSGDMTVEAWIKLNSPAVPPDVDFIYKRHNSAPWYSYQFLIDAATQRVAFQWRESTGVTEYTTSMNAGSLATGTWYHVAAVHSGNDLRLYINGSNSNVTNATTSGTLFDSDRGFQIGSSWQSEPSPDGILDEIRISGSALPLNWIQAEVCSAGGVVGGTGPGEYPAVTSAVSEIAPNAVNAASMANAFIYDILPTIGVNDTGVNQVVITAPAGYANLNVTAVSLGGTGKSASGSCPSPAAGEYCAAIAGQDITVTLGDQGGNGQVIQVVFDADAPGTSGSADFSATVDDTATTSPAQAVTAGNADGDGADNNSQAVTVNATAALSGTVTDDSEQDIRTGGSTIVLTLTGDTWVAAGAAFDAERQNIIDGLDSAGAEANGWDAVVKAGLAVTDVVRTSATVVTVTLPAFGGYDITANETVTATIPASALVLSGVDIVAAPTFTVSAATAALTGTVTDDSEIEIRAGGSIIILTLTNDTWVAAGAAFNAQRQNIIDGLDSAQAEAAGWDAVVKAGLNVTDVVRTSDTVVTVTLPAFATYDILITEFITATIPATAVEGGAIVAIPTFDVIADNSWYDINWPSRKALNLDGANFCTTVNAFPVPVTLTGDPDLQADARADGFDILFTADDGVTKLSHEIEIFTKASGDLVAWVKLDIVNGMDQTLYMYYGNAGAADQQDAPGVWDSNFEGVWHMTEEVAGTGNIDVYRDSTSNANHGDDDVSATGQTGQIGAGQAFDGADDQVNFGSDASLNIRNAITMSAWVNMSSRPTKDDWFNLLGKEAFPYHFYLYGRDTNLTTLGAYFELDTGNADLWDVTSIDIDPANGWAHVAVTFDGTDIKFYVDGALDHTENEPGIIDDSTGVNLVFTDNESLWFAGSVDEIRISDTALSADWIQAEVCTAGGVVGSPGPPEYPAVTAAAAEIAPNDVPIFSLANSFSYDVAFTIGGSDTGVDRVEITVPATFGDPAVTDVLVGGVSIGAAYTDLTAGKLISILLDTKLIATNRIGVVFTADGPAAVDGTGKDFTSTVDDSTTPRPAQAAVEGNGDADGGDANSWTVTASNGNLALVKKAFFSDGTPIASGATIPQGTPVKFMIYINNRTAARGDVSLRDVLNAAFGYQANSLKVTNGIAACAADACTGLEEDGIFTVVDGVAPSSDGIDGDVVSISGATIDVGDANVANGQLDINANGVWALLFSVVMN